MDSTHKKYRKPQQIWIKRLYIHHQKQIASSVLGLIIWLLGLPLSTQAQVINNFEKRFQTNDTGDIRFVSNTILTCPNVHVSMTASDVNGGNLSAGDTIEYRVTVTNNGSSNATNVVLTTTRPANTTYVTNSLKILSGANAGNKTDASGDDQAQISGSNITFRLGSGATGTVNGILAPGQSTELSFQVRVSSTFTSGNISSTINVDYLENSTSPAVTNRASAGSVFAVGSSTSTSSPNFTCAQAQSNIGTNLMNNDYSMRYVDVDADSSTFNSSRAQLSLPNDAVILFAGLYWGGDSGNAARNTVKIATPQSPYTTVTATSLYSTSYGGNQTAYQGFADVTELVGTGGNGIYTVANVQSTVNSSNRWGGWSLVVVYRAPGEQARNLTVFDGFARSASGTGTVTIPISGFIAPPNGQVKGTLGVISYDGDNSATGDRLRFRQTAPTTTPLSDIGNAVNPTNDAFNSSISYLGSQLSAKEPNYLNQLGYDADIFDISGKLSNGATGGEIQLTTGGETYLPGVVTSAIDLYAPNVILQKSYVDLNGGDLEIGDILEYTVTVTNNPDANGNGDPANENIVLDPIPTFTTYVPNSLVIDGVSKTDAVADDQAEFDSANNLTRFRLGTGANAIAGGNLIVNQNPATSPPTEGSSSTVKFRVSVNPNTPDNTEILNQAQSSYKGQTLGQGVSLAAASPTAKVKVNIPDGVSINKTDSPDPVTAGNTLTYKITVTNSGSIAAPNLEMRDPLPAGTTFTSLNAPANWNCTTPTVGSNGIVSCTIANFVSNTYPLSAEFTIVVKVNPNQTASLENKATVLSNNIPIDEAIEQTAVLVPVTRPHLSLVKRITAINNQPITGFAGNAADPNGNGNTTEDSYWAAPLEIYLRGSLSQDNVRPNDEVEYTIYFLNSQNPARNVIICDLIPDGQIFSAEAYNPVAISVAGDSGIAAAIYSSGVTTLPSGAVPNQYLSNILDSDRGAFFPANDPNTPSTCKRLNNLGQVVAVGEAANTNGAVVVNVVSNPDVIPPATARGNPPAAYGFIRFRALVK